MQRESSSSGAFGGWLGRTLLNVAGSGGPVQARSQTGVLVEMPEEVERLSDVELAQLGLSRGVLALRSGFDERSDEVTSV